MLAENPIDRLNQKDWKRFTAATGYGLKPSLLTRLLRGLMAAAWFKRFRTRHVQSWVWLLCLVIPVLTLIHRPMIKAVFKNFGVTDADGLRDFLEDTLRTKLNISDGRRVTFDDLKRPLKVIAADLVEEKLVLFPEHGSDSVVDAVVASATFPLFFRPSVLGDRVLIDGGILSNRPAWVFDDERQALTESIPTIAFLLVAKPLESGAVRPSLAPSSVYSYLVKMFRTAAFGNQRLETRAVDDYLPIPLATDVQTLDLEDGFRRADELIAQGEADATACFVSQIGPREPSLMLQVLQALSIDLYEQMRSLDAQPDGDVQCAVVMKTASELARVSYASYQPAADYGVKIRIDSPGPARCFDLKEPVLTIVDEIPKARRESPFFKYEHALRNPDLKTLYSIPVFQDASAWSLGDVLSRPTPIAVLTIGTIGQLENYFALPEVEDLLATYAQVLAFGLAPQATSSWIAADIEEADRSPEPGATWQTIDPASDAFRKSARPLRRIVPSDTIMTFYGALPPKFVVCALPEKLTVPQSNDGAVVADGDGYA